MKIEENNNILREVDFRVMDYEQPQTYEQPHFGGGGGGGGRAPKFFF